MGAFFVFILSFLLLLFMIAYIKQKYAEHNYWDDAHTRDEDD